MIIFYDKLTNDIFGVIDGRVHDDPENQMVKPENMDVYNVGRYVVPFKPNFIEVEIPIEKWFLKNKKTLEVEKRVVGTKKETVTDGMVPDVEFAQLILDFESGKENIYNYRVELSNDKVVGFIKK